VVKDCRDTVILLSVRGGLETAAQLNAFLVGRGIPVAELAEEKRGLEDLFLTISARENSFF